MENPITVADFATGAASPVDIKFGADGVMYYLDRGTAGGSLFRVTHADGIMGIRAPIRPKSILRRGALEILGLELHRRFDGRSLPAQDQAKVKADWSAL
jgi:hypothetical protein